MTIIKVLIVDDDAFVCRGLKTLIPWGELDAELIAEAGNGEEAYKIALAEHPDLIITDIKMPIMDGLELCKKVHATMADTSIILLSAHEDFEYARTAIKYGVKSYILKPIDREKINQLIENIRDISAEFSKKRNFYDTIYNLNIEKDFLGALKNADENFFIDFFEKKLPSMDIKNIEVKELCIKVVNLLFDYLEDIGVNTKSIQISKENIIDVMFTKKTRQEIESYTLQIFLDVFQLTSHIKDSHSDSIITYVKGYIKDNFYNLDLSVSSVADSLKLSPAYLGIIFRQVKGINISSYIADVRIDKACSLLKDPVLKMSDISCMVGYRDAHYFAKVFKKLKGITPSEYRNLNLGGEEMVNR